MNSADLQISDEIPLIVNFEKKKTKQKNKNKKKKQKTNKQTTRSKKITQHAMNVSTNFHCKSWVYLSKVVRTCKSVICTVKRVFSGHSKIDKAKVLKTNGRLMKVVSIAECSLGTFCMLLICIKRYSVLKTEFWTSF